MSMNELRKSVVVPKIVGRDFVFQSIDEDREAFCMRYS